MKKSVVLEENANPMSNSKFTDQSRQANGSIQQQLNTCPTLDRIFDFCALPIFWYAGIVWLVGVVVTGALLVFLLIPGVCNTQGSGPKELYCRQFSSDNIQVLLALFTAINLYGFPLRCARLYAVLRYPDRSGIDFRGNIVPTERPRTLLEESYDPSTFYYMAWSTKLSISVALLLSTLAQFVNQVFRLMYNTYMLSNKYPGTLWCNLFFAMSFFFMAIGGGIEGSADGKIRAEYPDKFPPIAPMVIGAKIMALFSKPADDVTTDMVPKDVENNQTQETL